METPSLTDKILIVDDEASNVLLLEKVLSKTGYQNLRGTQDPREAIPLYLEFQPDLILLDLMMPHIDGFQLLTLFRQSIAPSHFMPILVLTADMTQETRKRALSSGATDFLTKPFDAVEVSLRIKNLLQTRTLYRQLAQQNQLLEAQVQERTQELEEARIQILARLALAAEYRDDQTGQHTQRVGRTAALLASVLGFTEREMLLLRRAAPLHDVGKIGIPDHILLKPGKLTPQEFELMQTHTTIGARILSDDTIPLLQMATTIAMTHHERWDGRGYPQGLAGEAIPLVGRIVAVADVYDALTHERPYKAAWSSAAALTEIEQQSGQQFDPQVVRAFLTLVAANHLSEPEHLRDTGITNAAWASGVVRPGGNQPRDQAQPMEKLTPRELEVLQLLAQGQTNREIAQALFVSTGTVKVHVEHILGKLQVTDRTQAAVRALALGILTFKPDQEQAP